MLSGSRLGASFIVLLTGFLYAMRDKNARSESLGIGIQAMTMTAIVYLPGMRSATSGHPARAPLRIDWHASEGLDAVLSSSCGAPSSTSSRSHCPGWALFLVGSA